MIDPRVKSWFDVATNGDFGYPGGGWSSAALTGSTGSGASRRVTNSYPKRLPDFIPEGATGTPNAVLCTNGIPRRYAAVIAEEHQKLRCHPAYPNIGGGRTMMTLSDLPS
jgi:hypothetical protein